MKNLINTIRESVGVPEFFLLLGMALLYAGSAAQFNHAVAQIVCGAALVSISVIVSLREMK